MSPMVFLAFLLAAGFAWAENTSTATSDIENGAHYMKPFDLAVSADHVYILMQRFPSDVPLTGLLEEAEEVVLEVRSRASGEKLWRLELKPGIFGSTDSFGSIRSIKSVYRSGWLTILITTRGEEVSFLLRVGADGRIAGKRKLEGDGNRGTSLHRLAGGIALVFGHKVLLLNDELKTVSQWHTSKFLMAARSQGNALWLVEAEPRYVEAGFDAVALRVLTFDGNVIDGEMISPLPELGSHLTPASILTWTDEVVVLIPGSPEWQHCVFRAGMMEVACKAVIWEYASPGTPTSLGTVVSRAGTDSYLIARPSFCDVLSKGYNRSHRDSQVQPLFPKGRHVFVTDLIVKEDGGEVFALIAGGRGEPEALDHRTTFWPVRFVEASALPGDGRSATCPAWGNDDFFSEGVTVSTVVACVEAGADPNTTDECGGYYEAPPLAGAMAFSTPEVIETLLEAGANPDFRYRDGLPLLHKALWPGRAELLAVLLRAMKDVNARDRSGKTALHHAAQHPRPEVVDVLLDGGVDPTLRDDAGKLPWDYARENPEFKDSEALNRLKPTGA